MNNNGKNGFKSDVAGDSESREIQHVDMSRVGDSPGVDIQVKTAKTYPRDIKKFRKNAMSMATVNEGVAASCFYMLPQAGGMIPGPSVRLAEIVASTWGNLRINSRITKEEARFVYAESVAWDLETNVAICVETRRRITNKYGQRYNEDLIGKTALATIATSFRNSIFKVVPMSYTNEIYEEARRVAAGDVQTLAVKRTEMVNYFIKFGVTKERILYAVGKDKLEDVDLKALADLKGIATAIRDNDVQIDNAFPEIPKEGEPGNADKNKTGQLADELSGNATETPDKAEPDPDFEAKKKAAVAKLRAAEAEGNKETETREPVFAGLKGVL